VRLRELTSPTAFARRNAVYRGLLGGSRGWLYVGGFFWAARWLRRLLGRSAEVVASERLEQGQFVRVEAIAPTTRRQRRAAKSTSS
jgi:hypothetical protein